MWSKEGDQSDELESQNQRGSRMCLSRNGLSAAETGLRLSEATRALNIVTEVRARH
jgi:hypothetical protein